MPPPGQLAADFAEMQAFQAAVASMEPDAQFYFLQQIRNRGYSEALNCPALEMSFEVPTGYWQHATFVVGKKPLTTDDERATLAELEKIDGSVRRIYPHEIKQKYTSYKGWDNGVAVFEPHIYDDNESDLPVIPAHLEINGFDDWAAMGAAIWWHDQSLTRSFLELYFDKFLFLYTVKAATYDQKLAMLKALLCIPPGINSIEILFKVRNDLRKEFGMTYIKNYFGYLNTIDSVQHMFIDKYGRCLNFAEHLITFQHELMYALMVNPRTRRNISGIEAWRLEFLPPTPPRE
mmetsp:Transcript_18163/g.39171  ORF Transcript_18163/g.39171 Transcript_18163/m.39171 type:complete len:291 (+) Transcript_18163:90-962(+)